MASGNGPSDEVPYETCVRESQHSRLHGELQLDKRRRLLQDTNFALDDRLKEVRPSWCEAGCQHKLCVKC